MHATIAPTSWAATKAGGGGGGDSGEGVGEAARDGDGGIGERGRGREPVGRRDVEADDPGRGVRAKAQRAQDRSDQAEGRDELRKGLGGAVAEPGGHLQDRLGEHGVRDPDADDPGDHLDRDVGGGERPGDLAADRESQGHGRVEVGARDRPEDCDQDHEAGAGRQGIAQQGDGVVAAGEPFAHDPRTHDDGEEQGSAQGFGREAMGQAERLERRLEAGVPCGGGIPHAFWAASRRWPISSRRRWSERLSSDAIGRLMKSPIRLLSIR